MNINKFVTTPAGQITVIALVGAGVLYFGARQASKAASVVGGAINPNSPDNLAFGAVNAVGATVTGQDEFNLGHAIYDFVHGKPDI